jgi:predicted DNA-binding transcriptional regulator AlpA
MGRKNKTEKNPEQTPKQIRQYRDDEYIGELAVVEITKFSKFTLRNFRHMRQGPPYSKFNRSVRYLVGDVRAWMEAHKVTPAL